LSTISQSVTRLLTRAWRPEGIWNRIPLDFKNLEDCLARAIDKANKFTAGVLTKEAFWRDLKHKSIGVSERQRQIINRLFDGFEGELTLTDAMSEELGWRGFLLSHLERRLSPRAAALVMAITWALWHLPVFFFAGIPQQHMPPIAFLLMVAAFGIFLALLFNRTRGHLVSTMLAHFSFNMSLAVGGAILGSVFIWTLAFIFSIVAIFGLAKLSAQPIRIAQTGEVFTPLGTDIYP
jgi:hypothetical protein